MARRLEPTIPDSIIDELLAGADAKTIFDPNGLLDGLKKAFAERILNAEMDHHLDDDETGTDNSRNGWDQDGDNRYRFHRDEGSSRSALAF